MRGINVHDCWTVRRAGGRTFYWCPFCSFNVQRSGNALGGAAKCKGIVRRHVLEKHQNADAEAAELASRIGLAADPTTCAWCGRPVVFHSFVEAKACDVKLGGRP